MDAAGLASSVALEGCLEAPVAAVVAALGLEGEPIARNFEVLLSELGALVGALL
jgi:hypothetical protein